MGYAKIGWMNDPVYEGVHSGWMGGRMVETSTCRPYRTPLRNSPNLTKAVLIFFTLNSRFNAPERRVLEPPRTKPCVLVSLLGLHRTVMAGTPATPRKKRKTESKVTNFLFAIARLVASVQKHGSLW